MHGVRIVDMMGNGSTIRCMEREKLNGLMEENIKANIRMIKSMDLVHFIGLMAVSMWGDGKMVSSMEKENITCKMVIRRLVSGFREKG